MNIKVLHYLFLWVFLAFSDSAKKRNCIPRFLLGKAYFSSVSTSFSGKKCVDWEEIRAFNFKLHTEKEYVREKITSNHNKIGLKTFHKRLSNQISGINPSSSEKKTSGKNLRQKDKSVISQYPSSNDNYNAQQCLNWTVLRPQILASSLPQLLNNVDHNNTENTTLCEKFGAWNQPVCPVRVKNKIIVRTCPKQNVEPENRIDCRLSDDTMTWYTGTAAMTITGKRCQRWDELHGTWHFFGATDFAQIPFQPVASVSEQENFCRNPDNSTWGPWCFVKATSKSKASKEPCFPECISKNTTNSPLFCLPKQIWPWNNSHPNQNLGEFLTEEKILSKVVGARPEYEYAIRISEKSFEKSSVVKCYQDSRRTTFMGPWTYVTKPETSAEHSGKDPLWTPCFTACEDLNMSCIPRDKITDYNYQGPREHSITNKPCEPWSDVAQIVLDASSGKNAADLSMFFGRIEGRTGILFGQLETFYHFLLKQDPVHAFAYNFGSTLASRRCLNIWSFYDRKHWPFQKAIQSGLNTAMTRGPFCYIKRKLPYKKDKFR